MSPRENRSARIRRALERRLGRVAAEHAYPVRDWQIVEREVLPADAGALESVFAVANGYVGVRGAPEEGTSGHAPGVTINGLHETWPIVYPEDAYGLARTGQAVVNATDGSVVRLYVDDEPFDLATAKVRRYERVLDMQLGVLTREVEWDTRRGRRVLVRSRRLASLHDRHLVAIDYEVVALDGPVRVAISSELVTHPPEAAAEDDPRRGRAFAEPVLVAVSARAAGTRAVLELATATSGHRLACGMEHAVDCPAPVGLRAGAEGDLACLAAVADLEPGQPLRLSKFVAYHWSPRPSPDDLTARVERTLDRAAADGYDVVEFEHRSHVEDFWRRSDVQIDGAPEIQQAVRFNLFELMQATARAEGLGVPAKGVTGRGYDGHYF